MTEEEIEANILALGIRCHHLRKYSSAVDIVSYETDAHRIDPEAPQVNLFLRIIVDKDVAHVIEFAEQAVHRI